MSRVDPFSGARAQLLINNKEIGYAVDVSGGESLDRIPIRVLNNPRVKEFAPVGYDANLRCSKVYVFADDLKAMGLFPKTASNPTDHMANILSLPEMTIDIIDSFTNTIFASAQGVDMAARDWSFGSRDVVFENVEFVVKAIYGYADIGT